MDDTTREKISALSPMPTCYRLPQHRALVEVLEKKLDKLLDQVDIISPQDPSALDYCMARMIIQLLLYDRIDFSELAHQLQQENGAFNDPLEFDAAGRILFDWCETGGKTAAEIGFSLNN